MGYDRPFFLTGPPYYHGHSYDTVDIQKKKFPGCFDKKYLSVLAFLFPFLVLLFFRFEFRIK